MDKLKYVKLENPDGTYSDSIPLAVDGDHVDVNGNTLIEELGKKTNYSDISNLQNEIKGLASGSPLVANSISGMTDTKRVYVNTTDGNWYYYNGSTWIIGGTYQSTGIGIEEVKQENLANNLSQFYYLDMLNDFTWESGNINANGTMGANKNRARTKEKKFLKKGSLIKVNYGYSIGIHKYINNVHTLIKDSIPGNSIYQIPEDAEYKFVVFENPYGTYTDGFYGSEAFYTTLNNISIELKDRVTLKKQIDKKIKDGYDIKIQATYNSTSNLINYSANTILLYLDLTDIDDLYYTFNNETYNTNLEVYNENTNTYTVVNNWNSEEYTLLGKDKKYLILFRRKDSASISNFESEFSNVNYRVFTKQEYNDHLTLEQLKENDISMDASFASEVENVRTELLTNQNSNTLTFAFISDLHYDNSISNQVEMYKNITYAMAELNNSANIDFIAYGGDNTSNLWPRSLVNQKKLTNEVKSMMYEQVKKPLLIANGNHDDNSIRTPDITIENQEHELGYTILGEELYKYYSKMNENTNVVFGELGNNYFYVDFPTQKIRVFILNCIDIPYELNANNKLTYAGQWTYAYRNNQLNFVADALKFEDKGNDASNWASIFIEHINLPDNTTFRDYSVINDDIMVGIINAYQEGTTYQATGTRTDFEYDVNVTYNHQGKVIASFGGHMHTDQYQLYNGIQCINSITARYTDREGYNDLVDKTAFDIFTIDTKNQTINATRFGYGSSRTFNY